MGLALIAGALIDTVIAKVVGSLTTDNTRRDQTSSMTIMAWSADWPEHDLEIPLCRLAVQ
jgi:hypothetical protein